VANSIIINQRNIKEPHLLSIDLKPEALNPKSQVSVVIEGSTNGDKGNVLLQLGDVVVKFNVTSGDGKNQKTYSIVLRKGMEIFRISIRERIANLMHKKEKPKIPIEFLNESAITKEFICAFCSGGLYAPFVSKAHTDCKHTFCQLCQDLLSRFTDKVTHSCPLCFVKYPIDPSKSPNLNLQSKINEIVLLPCPYVDFGCSITSVTLKDSIKHIIECADKPLPCTDCENGVFNKSVLSEGKHKEACCYTCSCGRKVPIQDRLVHEGLCPSKIELPKSIDPALRSWESDLADKKKCPSTIEACLDQVRVKYETYKNGLAQAFKQCKQSFGSNPLTPPYQTLAEITTLLATAISLNTEAKKLRGGSLDYSLHFQLGLHLEEVMLAKYLFPEQTIQKKVAANDNNAANESFMNDEFNGLLMSLGINFSATNGAKLQAVEQEYHRLLSQGLSDQVVIVFCPLTHRDLSHMNYFDYLGLRSSGTVSMESSADCQRKFWY
jgi:hypothetical protein